MPGYVLSCCSTVDLTREWLEGRDVKYVYFNYQLDGKPCKDDFGQTNSPAELYAKMLAGAEAKTSQVSAGDYIEHFEKYLEQGLDVVHATLSSGISGTYNSACAARDELAKKYPDRKVIVIDSLCASAGYGLFIDKLADLRDAGLSAEELAAWAEAHKLEVQHWFFSTELTFFVRGGRIFKRDLEIMEELVQDGLDYSGKVFISNSECEDDAREVASRVEAKFQKIDGPVHVFPIGATIGCHTGPGTVALFFWGKPRA